MRRLSRCAVVAQLLRLQRNNNNSHHAATVVAAAHGHDRVDGECASPVTRPWRCPECGKGFVCADNLHTHRRTRHAVCYTTQAQAQRAALARDLDALTRRLRTLRARRDSVKAAIAALAQRSDAQAQATTRVADGAAAVACAFAAAVPTRQTVRVDAAQQRRWCASGEAVGTTVSQWFGVGVVHGGVRVGTLAGSAAATDNDNNNDDNQAKSGTPTTPRVLQFTLETHGHHSRRAGRQRLFRNRVVVRYIADAASSSADVAAGTRPLVRVIAGDVVYVHGHYGRHASFDVVSKQRCEHVVVEADYIGLLRGAASS